MRIEKSKKRKSENFAKNFLPMTCYVENARFCVCDVSYCDEKKM